MSMTKPNNSHYYQSVLIISEDISYQNSQVSEIINNYKISASNIIRIKKPEDKQSLGIDSIQDAKRSLSISTSQDTVRALIIENIDSATIPAQNALLKTIEEPAPNTLVILTAYSDSTILATIISRCRVHKQKQQATHSSFDASVLTAEKGVRMELAEQLAKDKEDATYWLSALEQHYHNSLYEKQDIKVRTNLEKTSRARRLVLTSNVNTRLLLENLLLEL